MIIIIFMNYAKIEIHFTASELLFFFVEFEDHFGYLTAGICLFVT